MNITISEPIPKCSLIFNIEFLIKGIKENLQALGKPFPGL